VDKLGHDLARLIERGKDLENAMMRAAHPAEFDRVAGRVFGEEADSFIDGLPTFEAEYDAWYSEALVIVKKVLPDRLKDFRGLYERPRGRRTVDAATYVIQDHLTGLKATDHGHVIAGAEAALPLFRQQMAILRAAVSCLDSALLDTRRLVQASLLDSGFRAARELVKNGHLRTAGVLVGVLMEGHLRELCRERRIRVPRSNPSVTDMAERLREAGVIDISQWRRIQHLGDIRNRCTQKHTEEPTATQIDELLGGGEWLVRNVG
jgi:hypothetical protein